MIWHIAKRELYDNLNSLRFALAILLMLSLMLTNAIVHLQTYPVRLEKYRADVRDTLNILGQRTDLYDIAQKGPGNLYKKPSVLRFCADGGEDFFPDTVQGGDPWLYTDDLKGVWKMVYPSVTPNLENIHPDAPQMDWTFIIGYVLSLIALFFTFDAISGERERGTLRLILANAIPRHTLLMGKFFGAFISISIPFTLALLVNLLVISTSNAVHFNAETWGRLGIIFSIALLYTSLFLALGILVSSRTHRSSVSLAILLLAWVTFVFFLPNTLASVAGQFSMPMSTDEYRRRASQRQSELWDAYDAQLWGNDSYKRMQARSEFVIKEAAQQERLNEEHLTQKIQQVRHARAISRISFAAILRHLLEAFAGTGVERHSQFVENAQRYARSFRAFVVDTDRADPHSLHLIGVLQGMSQQSVNRQALPKFEDTLSLSEDFNGAATELLLLVMFLVVLLAGTYLAFMTTEV